MSIFVNEQAAPWRDGLTAGAVRDLRAPQADVLILNGAPVAAAQPLRDGDRLVLIARGQVPAAAELEALLVARHTPGVHARVRQATVGVAGLGGLGSTVAGCLARLGVGGLILADFDVVEPSNLNRQQYFVDQIGLPKTEALAATLRRVNPYVGLRCHNGRLTDESLAEVFRDAAAVVECFDAAEAKAMALRCARTALRRLPWVMASGLAGHGPSNALKVRRLFDNVVVVGDGVSAAQPGSGLMAPRVTVCAGMQANAVLRLLLGEPPED